MRDYFNWRLLSRLYMKELMNNPYFRDLKLQQAEGHFSGSPIKVEHYIDVMEFASFDAVMNKFEKPVRIIDVGSYLNLFSDFINNFDKKVSETFVATGIENSPVMCEISNRLFPSNNLIQGDAAELSALVSGKFDIVILNNFFHLEYPYEKSFILKVFSEIDGIISPGGLIFYKFDNKRIAERNEMMIVSREGETLRGKDFLTGDYSYSNDKYNHFWYVIKKNAKRPH